MKKIRGYNRLHKQIEQWKRNNLRLNTEYLFYNQRDYVQFRIFSWNDLAMSINNFPPPNFKMKQIIINSFLDIYDNWKIQLDELKEPYYLKIWLYEPDIWNTQVVCAFREELDFYDNTFAIPKKSEEFIIEKYKNISDRLKKYNWEFRYNEYPIFENENLDETEFKSEEEFLSNKKWFEKQVEKAHRIDDIKFDGCKPDKIYWIRKGSLWLGEKS